jgi:hypothetical protein
MGTQERLALVISVLSAIPVHQLLVIAPDKKTIKAADRIRRGFLRAAKDSASGGQCIVNWGKVCRPLSYGGLGVQDLERAGIALRLRWMWLSITNPTKPWTGLDMQFTAKEQAMFFASTRMSVGDGNTAQFWIDRWIDSQAIKEIAPEVADMISKHIRKSMTVSQGLLDDNWSRPLQVGLQSGVPQKSILALNVRVSHQRSWVASSKGSTNPVEKLVCGPKRDPHLHP